MTKSTAKNSALATAKESALEVQSTEIVTLPIAADAQSALATFTARPSIAATGSALATVKQSLIEIWEYEQETQTGKRFAEFAFDASKRIALPILNLGWLAANKGYQHARKPETKAAAIAKWKTLKAWLAPKFAYETEADRNSELKLND